jgi:hypothetical protein
LIKQFSTLSGSSTASRPGGRSTKPSWPASARWMITRPIGRSPLAVAPAAMDAQPQSLGEAHELSGTSARLVGHLASVSSSYQDVFDTNEAF